MPDQTSADKPSADRQWTDDVVERIDSVVGTVRDKTAVPLAKIVRVIMFGIIVASLAVVALVLLIIGVLRLHVYLPFHPEARRVWVTYAGLGAIFVVVGLFLLRLRAPRTR